MPKTANSSRAHHQGEQGGGYGQPQHLSNVGFGLRLSSSKARVGKLLHLDVAYPLAEKDRVDPFQWVITAANRF